MPGLRRAERGEDFEAECGEDFEDDLFEPDDDDDVGVRDQATSPRGSSGIDHSNCTSKSVIEPRLSEIERLRRRTPDDGGPDDGEELRLGDAPVSCDGDTASAPTRLAWEANTSEMMPYSSGWVGWSIVADLYLQLVVREAAKYGKQSSETAGSLVAGFQSSIRSRSSVNFTSAGIPLSSTSRHGLGGRTLHMDELQPKVGSRIASAASDGVPIAFIVCPRTT